MDQTIQGFSWNKTGSVKMKEDTRVVISYFEVNTVYDREPEVTDIASLPIFDSFKIMCTR